MDIWNTTGFKTLLASLGFLSFVMILWYSGIRMPTANVQEKCELRSSTVRDPDVEVRNTLARRRELLIQGCDNVTRVGTHKKTRIILNDEYRLAYCEVPKTGCTFWKRFFHFINSDFESNKEVKSLLQIDRHFVHFTKQKFEQIDFASDEEKRRTKDFTKFMFSRDPYKRLLSAYIDKFLLPDFWNLARAILKDRNASSKKKCPDDITFREFLNYSLKVGDWHWDPVTDVCDPCNFMPDVIGKVESFAQDRDFILKESDLSHVVKGDRLKTHVETEVETITGYNYLLPRKGQGKLCISKKQLAKKLWYAFQLNGYVRKSAAFPEKKIGEIEGWDRLKVKDHVTKVFINEVQKDPLTEEESRNQRRHALKVAYRAVPREIIDRIQRKFENDFVLFGYDIEPPV